MKQRNEFLLAPIDHNSTTTNDSVSLSLWGFTLHVNYYFFPSLSHSGETEEMEASVNQPPPKNGPQQNQKRNARVSVSLRLHANTTFNKTHTTKNMSVNTLILPHMYDADRP